MDTLAVTPTPAALPDMAALPDTAALLATASPHQACFKVEILIIQCIPYHYQKFPAMPAPVLKKTYV